MILEILIIRYKTRVSNYTVAESNRSPLEFLGRSDASGNSASNVLASDESITLISLLLRKN